MKIREMKVNHLTNPMGFELHKPVFSWKVDDAAGKKQQAAKIRIFSDPSCKRELAIKEGNLNSLSIFPFSPIHATSGRFL